MIEVKANTGVGDPVTEQPQPDDGMVEVKVGQTTEAEQSEEAPPEQPTETQDSEESNEAQESAEASGLDFEKYYGELAEKGQLSEESYKEIQSKVGLSKEQIDLVIEGLRARAEKEAQKFYEAVGGEANYKAMIEWASKNLSEDEIEAYNDTIMKGTEKQIALAVEGLYARYAKANPSRPKTLIQGITSSANSGDVYTSVAQLTEDMSSERYKKDPAFRDYVAKKLARSNIL